MFSTFFNAFFFAVFRYTVFPSSIPVLSFDTAVSGNTGIPPKPSVIYFHLTDYQIILDLEEQFGRHS